MPCSLNKASIHIIIGGVFILLIYFTLSLSLKIIYNLDAFSATQLFHSNLLDMTVTCTANLALHGSLTIYVPSPIQHMLVE